MNCSPLLVRYKADSHCPCRRNLGCWLVPESRLPHWVRCYGSEEKHTAASLQRFKQDSRIYYIGIFTSKLHCLLWANRHFLKCLKFLKLKSSAHFLLDEVLTNDLIDSDQPRAKPHLRKAKPNHVLKTAFRPRSASIGPHRPQPAPIDLNRSQSTSIGSQSAPFDHNWPLSIHLYFLTCNVWTIFGPMPSWSNPSIFVVASPEYTTWSGLVELSFRKHTNALAEGYDFWFLSQM